MICDSGLATSVAKYRTATGEGCLMELDSCYDPAGRILDRDGEEIPPPVSPSVLDVFLERPDGVVIKFS